MNMPQIPPIRRTLASRWQVPALALGVGLLSGGIFRIVEAHQPVSFEQHMQRVHHLQTAGALSRASAYLKYLLEDKERPVEQQAELHRALVRTIHLAEVRLGEHLPENSLTIIHHFNRIVDFGATPEARDWVALGDAYTWSDRPGDGVGAYRQAIRLAPDRVDRIHRKIVAVELDRTGELSVELIDDLGAILAHETASPANIRWALEQKAEWLLNRDEMDAAKALVEQGKKRLSGTGEKLALGYTEALCLWRMGQVDASEALLRSLRNGWRVRDDLWGRCGWLLGRLQQEDDRPQAALSFFEEVVGAFQTGRLYEAAQLGRAECLSVLERYEHSLAVFSELASRRRETDPTHSDRHALRTTITTLGQERITAGDRELGIRYLELALSLVDASDKAQRASYLSRIAAGLADIAANPSGAASRDDRREGYQRAADLYAQLAELRRMNSAGAAAALAQAADNYELAGRVDRLIDVLAQLIHEHPQDLGREKALYRLGQAYQATEDHAAAVTAYERVLKDYPRQSHALKSMVPLAESLIRVGGGSRDRGVGMLVDIVDDLGDDALFTPEANEYRQALFRLAEYYSRADAATDPAHYEKAIVRLEQAIALYPDDPRVTRMRFLSSESYRSSGTRMLEDPKAEDEPAIRREGLRRMRLAMRGYEQVKDLLAGRDAETLTDLELTYLHASYLYIADCLFDLGELELAVEAYREAAWRYENEPTAISATMQVVHCFQRLGRTAEATAALARLEWLLKKIPATEFDSGRGTPSKAYWESLVSRLSRTAL